MGNAFLLVPEATTVDADTLKLLCAAKEKDIVLSHNSPIGIRFHYLKGSSAEKENGRALIMESRAAPALKSIWL